MTSSREGDASAMEAPGDSALAAGDVASQAGRVRYILRPVTKPLGSAPERPRGQAAAFAPRAENEDDDGYDPYSDFHDGNAAGPLFEENPWR